MNKFVIQSLMMLGGTSWGTLVSTLMYLDTLLKSGFNTATKFHQEGIAFARQMGMSAKEAQAYTEVLTNRTEKLAAKYGIAAEQVMELQRNISVATSRQLMLNDAQAEQFLQLNKLVGSNTVSKFTEEMMNGMGGQIGTVQGAVAKAYATAAKSGLNAQKVSEKIASNLNMANKLSFRTGIDGLTRMAMQAEKVGMNLQSVESVAKNFLEIDDAIANSARLQMLGGSAAIMGGNPLDIAFEANNDPEALQKRMIKMLGGYAQFDAQKGIANINGVNMDFVRNIAKAMGISEEEAARISKKNAENRYKENRLGSSFKTMYTREQQDFLINKSFVENGRVYVTDKEGNKQDITNGKLPSKILEEMMKYQNMSDRDIMEKNAESLTSINEILLGFKNSIGAMFAKFLTSLFPDFQEKAKDFGAWAKDKLEPIAQNVGVAVRGAFEWLKEHKEPIKSFLSAVGKFITFATDHWKALLLIIGGWKLAGLLRNGGILGRGGGGFGFGGPAVGSAIGRGSVITQTARADYASRVGHGIGKKDAFIGAHKTAVRNAGGYGKLAKVGLRAAKGGGIAAIGGMVGGAIVDNMAENGDIEKGGTTHKFATAGTRALEYGGTGAMIGGMLGSFVPVIGNAVGAGVGAAIGGIWGGISGWLDAAEEGAKKGAKAANHEYGGPIWGLAKSGFIDKGSKGAETPIEKVGEDTGYYGEVVLNPTQQKNFMAIANGETTIKAKPVGEREYIYTPRSNETSNVNGNTITVKDFNINLSGTLRLDGGNSSKNIDVNELLRDQAFVTALKDVIKNSINHDINGGRFMNDLATMGGFPSQTSIYARRK